MLWWIVAAAVLAWLGYAGWTYNRLVALGRRADGGSGATSTCSSDGRWDLIPALVGRGQGYAGHESSTLERPWSPPPRDRDGGRAAVGQGRERRRGWPRRSAASSPWPRPSPS